MPDAAPAPPPDLSSAQGRAAYAAELAAVARPFRWLGLALVALGVAALALVDHRAGAIAGWALIGFGWAQVAMGLAVRLAYHRRRTRGE